MNRLLHLSTLLAILLALTACGGGGGSSTDTDDGTGDQVGDTDDGTGGDDADDDTNDDNNDDANHAPIAQDQTASTTQGIAITITLSATDEDGDTLTFAVSTAPSHGTAAIIGSELIYTPASDYTGTDIISYTASDELTTSAPASIAITVTAASDEYPALPDYDPSTTLASTPSAIPFMASADDIYWYQRTSDVNNSFERRAYWETGTAWDVDENSIFATCLEERVTYYTSALVADDPDSSLYALARTGDTTLTYMVADGNVDEVVPIRPEIYHDGPVVSYPVAGDKWSANYTTAAGLAVQVQTEIISVDQTSPSGITGCRRELTTTTRAWSYAGSNYSIVTTETTWRSPDGVMERDGTIIRDYAGSVTSETYTYRLISDPTISGDS